MVRRQRAGVRRLSLGAVVLLLGAWLVSLSPSGAAVTDVKGSAFGYFLNVTLLAAPQPVVGPTPTVALPPGGSANAVTSGAATGSAAAGPAQFFSSGSIALSTQGTPAGGSVTSTAVINMVNTSTAESLTASKVSSSCTASESGVSGSTMIENGTLLTDTGDNLPNSLPDHMPVTVSVPTNPAPNTVIEGHIHVNGVTDNFRYVFNEQIRNPDGSITVNAGHQYALGGLAVGDLIFGQVVCGVTATAPSSTSSTAVSSSTSSTTPSGSSTTSTTTAASTTSSTTASTTTTSVLASTTTTATPAPGLPLFVTEIICRVLRSLQSLPFVGPFLAPLFTLFRCGAG